MKATLFDRALAVGIWPFIIALRHGNLIYGIAIGGNVAALLAGAQAYALWFIVIGAIVSALNLGASMERLGYRDRKRKRRQFAP